jgi:hypothetical protein
VSLPLYLAALLAAPELLRAVIRMGLTNIWEMNIVHIQKLMQIDFITRPQASNLQSNSKHFPSRYCDDRLDRYLRNVKANKKMNYILVGSSENRRTNDFKK